MGAFDPSAMHVTRLAEADLGESVADTTAQISLIADGDVRQRCASAKLAAQIVSRVYHVSADLGDGEILGGMTNVLKRLAAVRQTCLAIAGVNEDHPDYGAAFAMCTAVALETVTEEFKWRQIGGRTKELPMALFGRLIEAVSAKQPRLFPKSSGQLDLGAARKLATLHAAPVMMGLVNLFDFYVMDTEAMACRLVYAVAAQAEFHALQGVDGMTEYGQALMIQRAYGVSVDVMAQVYNACARKAVEKLHDMQEIDRAFAIGNYERIGGMNYEHVLEEHDRVMRKTYEVCELIVIAQSGRSEGKNVV
ncbi:hypothetical protein [Paracidovorax sp. MALMAid1276]|uniref:hypothetical protein n=1 Tax=Paracidovorax sp. MALMAid1276 TaxID=3411631 RepID=UPI003B9A356E